MVAAKQPNIRATVVFGLVRVGLRLPPPPINSPLLGIGLTVRKAKMDALSAVRAKAGNGGAGCPCWWVGGGAFLRRSFGANGLEPDPSRDGP